MKSTSLLLDHRYRRGFIARPIPTGQSGAWLGSLMDYTLLTLVGLLFFCVRFDALLQHSVKEPAAFLPLQYWQISLLVPLVGLWYCIIIFVGSQALFMVGLIIYFMSPCTDWFLSFTRLSGGNVALGTALIPINMTMQLLLYPYYLQWFSQSTVQIEAGTIGSTLLNWFFLPLLLAIICHQVLRVLLTPGYFKGILDRADQATLWLTAFLVLQIFAGNIPVIMEHIAVFIWVLVAVLTFFLLTFLLVESLSRLFQLGYPEHALLTMTVAARNAPLMLAVTLAALPNQPLIYAALIIGMLVELPYLTALLRWLHRTRQLKLPAQA